MTTLEKKDDVLKKKCNERRPQQKMEDDLRKNGRRPQKNERQP